MIARIVNGTIGLCLFITGTIILKQGIYYRIDTLKIEKENSCLQAEVTNKIYLPQKGKSPECFFIEFSFTFNSKTYFIKKEYTKEGFKKTEISECIQICFDPDDPQKVRLTKEDPFTVLYQMVVILLGLGISLLGLHSLIRKTKPS